MKYLYLLPLILISFFCQAQNNRQFIAISYGIGDGQKGYYRSAPGIGAMEGKSLNIFGVNYCIETNKNLFLETGIQYVDHKYIARSSQPPFTQTFPGKFKFINIPVKLRFEFAKIFFLNGGVLGDLYLKENEYEENYVGMGLGLGGGVQFHLKNKISVYVNPQVNFHQIITIPRDNAALTEKNVTFGLAYRIK
jgi:hypothetical protein